MIVGASRPEQVRENVRQLEERPPEDALARLDAMATAPTV
jgi:aryl-alcohol dehydrogenase-like predicted oxidoreductase